MTVMFIDLVGSTKLGGRLGAESYTSVMRDYHRTAVELAERYGGFSPKTFGDGVLVFFGYPTAHEDDPERAVRAALAIQKAIPELPVPGGQELLARIGIATGVVVAGADDAFGKAPNIAARLQARATPRQIVITGQTRDLIGGLFELRDLGRQDLEGVDEEVVAYAVLDERSIESRFEAQRRVQLTAMVGRDPELTLLRDRWRDACSGKGQVVFVQGEAGIGKSRMVRALRDSLAADAHVLMHHQCSPHHSDSALYPVIHQLARAAGISASDSAKVRLERIADLLAGAAPGDIALIATLLGVDLGERDKPLDERYKPLELSPQQQRLRTFEALINQLVRVAASRSVLWVLEDVHWTDPTTLELVQRYIEHVGNLPLLAVITARPSFTHDFGTFLHLMRLELNRLEPSDIKAMVDGLTRGKPLPGHVMAEIVTKTDGVPLFVEEVTKSMLESGLVRETETAFVVSNASQQISVPESLQDSLMARLDRLRPYKEVAQTASCIGREFSYPLLSRVCPVSEEVLRDSLARLVDAELIYQRSGADGLQYAFKHALVRDAAYESLLLARRAQIHTRLVAALEQLPDTAPEVIAQHAVNAQLDEKAIDYWEKAAAQAFARPAYKETIAHLKRAIDLAEGMGDNPVWQGRRLKLLMKLGQAATPLYGYSHSETVSIFKKARALANAMGGGPYDFSILYPTWVAHYVGGEQDKALETGHIMLEAARVDLDEGHRLAGLRALAISQMITGAPATAAETFEQARQLAETLSPQTREQRIAVADRLGADPEIATQFHICLTLWSLGRVDEARTLANQAVAAARELGHAHTVGHAVTHGAIFAVVCRDADRALELSTESIAFAGKHEMELWKGYGPILHGFALALKGDAAGSVRFMETGFAFIARTQTGAMVPLHRAMQARTLASLGRFDEAQHQADSVLQELRGGSERYFWPECRRLLGDYLRLCPGAQREQIEAAYAGAYAIAHRQGTPSWELYAATSLARWWAEQRQPGKALDLMVPLLKQFTQGFDSPGYREATSLLQSLQT